MNHIPLIDVSSKRYATVLHLESLHILKFSSSSFIIPVNFICSFMVCSSSIFYPVVFNSHAVLCITGGGFQYTVCDRQQEAFSLLSRLCQKDEHQSRWIHCP